MFGNPELTENWVYGKLNKPFLHCLPNEEGVAMLNSGNNNEVMRDHLKGFNQVEERLREIFPGVSGTLSEKGRRPSSPVGSLGWA